MRYENKSKVIARRHELLGECERLVCECVVWCEKCRVNKLCREVNGRLRGDDLPRVGVYPCTWSDDDVELVVDTILREEGNNAE